MKNIFRKKSTDPSITEVYIIRRNGEMKTFFVDTDDIPLLKGAGSWIWNAGAKTVAAVFMRGGARVPASVTLGRFLLDYSGPNYIAHVNGNRLDFRRSNLKVVWRGTVHLGGKNASNLSYNRSLQTWDVRFKVKNRLLSFGEFLRREDAEARAEEILKRLRAGETPTGRVIATDRRDYKKECRGARYVKP
jgi:hypothetical protein